MKTTFRYNSLNAEAPWPPLVTQQIEHLQSLTAITASEIVLEHQREANPAFRVHMRLDIAGSDLRAQASDSTLEAALSKATQDLADQIQTRNTNPSKQGKNRPQASAISARRTDRGTGATSNLLGDALPRPTPPSLPTEESAILRSPRRRRNAI